MMSIRARVFGIAAVGCLLGFAAIAPASASPDQPVNDPGKPRAEIGFPTGQDAVRMQNQAALDAVADAVMFDESGQFAGVVDPVLDVDSRTMLFKWYRITAQQKEAVTAMGAARKIAISFEDFPYSNDQVAAAMKALSGAALSLLEQGLTITAMVPHPSDGGALMVGVHRANTSKLSRTQAADAIKVVAGIDVTVSERNFDGVPYATRQTDVPRFYAGGYMGSVGCTSGFAMQTYSASYLLTALHCGSGPFAAWDTGTPYGSSAGSTPGHAQVIAADSGGFAFLGWYGSSTNRRVSASQHAWSGDWVCVSGGNTGEHCSLKVFESSGFPWTDDGVNYYTVATARQMSSDIGAGKGDSGAPVLNYQVDGTVHAIGVVQGGTDAFQVTCPSTTRTPPGHCSQEITFTQIDTVLNGVPGLYLKTS